MKFKICGLKHPDNVHQLLTLEPDYLGFIFYKKSPRYVGEVADLAWVKNLAKGLSLKLPEKQQPLVAS